MKFKYFYNKENGDRASVFVNELQNLKYKIHRIIMYKHNNRICEVNNEYF